MAVRILKKSWWVDISFNKDRYRLKSPENSKTGARAYETLLRSRLLKGEDINGPAKEKTIPTFLEFSEEWFKTYVMQNNKLSEQMHKRSALDAHLLPFFGKLSLDEITNQKVEEFKAATLKKITRSGTLTKAKTVNNLTSILAKCLGTATEWEIIEKLPRIQKLKVPPYKYDFLTIEEEGQLIAAAHGVWKEMITMAVDSGLRLGELSALDWPSIDLAKKEIVVRRSFTVKQMSAPKSNRERRVPMTNRVYQMLLNKNGRIGLIFTLEPNQPLQQNRCRNTLIRICHSANLRPLKWHSLRHTYASRIVSHGGSMKAVQELLGHSDIQTTMRYAHLEKNVLRETVNLLNDVQDFRQPAGNQTKKQEVNAFY